MAVLGPISWNNTRIEAFSVDPDELPVLDTATVIAGVNAESMIRPGLMVGASWRTVPAASQSSFSPVGTNAGTRDGLDLVDLRFTCAQPGGQSGFLGSAEVARQTNRNVDMAACAAYGEIASAIPGPAVSDALGGTEETGLSAMAFVRYAC